MRAKDHILGALGIVGLCFVAATFASPWYFIPAFAIAGILHIIDRKIK